MKGISEEIRNTALAFFALMNRDVNLGGFAGMMLLVIVSWSHSSVVSESIFFFSIFLELICD